MTDMYLIFNRQIVIVCGVCRVSRENILPLPLPWIIVAVGILLLFLLVILSCVVHRIRRRSKYFFLFDIDKERFVINYYININILVWKVLWIKHLFVTDWSYLSKLYYCFIAVYSFLFFFLLIYSVIG